MTIIKLADTDRLISSVVIFGRSCAYMSNTFSIPENTMVVFVEKPTDATEVNPDSLDTSTSMLVTGSVPFP